MTTGVIIAKAQHRERLWWVVAGALFIGSAALLAVRSMPGNLPGEVLAGLNWATTITFALAALCSAVALWPGGRGSVALRGAATATALFGVWALVGASLLSVFPDDTMLLIDAVIRILIGGTAVGCLLLSSLSLPWRATPAIVFAVVVASTLLAQLALANHATMDLAITAVNLLLLVKIAAAAMLGVVALQGARLRRQATTTVI